MSSDLHHHHTRRQFLNLATSVVAAAAASGVVAGETPKPGSGRLQAGVGEAVVTPAVGTFLIGPMAASTGVNDDLFVRVLVLDDGVTRIAFVALDYLGFDFDYTAELLAAVARGSGAPVEQVLLNCSHTHSAPLTAQWGPWREHRGAEFYRLLPKQLESAAAAAARSLQPVGVRLHRAPVQIGVNRRLLHRDRTVMAPNPAGKIVPFVDVLAFEGGDGEPMAVLFCHAAHPVIVHGASTLISGDFPGFAVQRLKTAYRRDTHYLFAQGCAGDVNGVPLRGGIEAAQAAGRDLGDAVIRALQLEPVTRPEGPLRVQTLELALPLRPPPPAEKVKEMLAAEKNAERRGRFQRLLGLAEGQPPAPMPCPLKAVAIGSGFCLATMPHEPFAEYHARVVQALGFPEAMVLGYTNGLECYLGTEKDFLLAERGGYEVSPYGAAFMYERSLPLAPEAEHAVIAGWEKLGRALRT